MIAARIIIGLALTYLAIGAIFATWFVTVGVGRMDPVARAGTPGFRLLIWPGAAALWPLLLGRAARAPAPVETHE